ncbi:MAG TPA: response regulator [Steroidobacteraceae bacterium]|jgi:FixJ family two-component response regulator|nr:response regulator [Steroidobacteraceae bacterium]
MAEAVLFVDDEPHLLDGIARSLRQHFSIHTATSGAAGLRLLQSAGPFAVVVSDMRMPEMDGVQFLSKVAALAPDTVRVILTGQADLAQTIAAVNEGHIFRFLNKPCTTQFLQGAVENAIAQHRLITAEKVLLEQTLTGAVNMLLEILSAILPSAHGRARRLQRYIVALARALALPVDWQWPLAASVSQVGCISIPKDILAKVEAEQPLSDDEQRLFDSHPRMAGKMLEAIPRLEGVAAIVTAQNMPLSQAETFARLSQLDARTAGRILLRAVIEYDRYVVEGHSAAAAAQAVRASAAGLPAEVLETLPGMPIARREYILRSVRLIDLAPGMLLDEALVTLKGVCLVPAGHEVTPTLLQRLCGIDAGLQVREPFRVQVPT